MWRTLNKIRLVLNDDSRLNNKTSFHVNYGGKVWDINLLDDDDEKKVQAILDALDKMHEPTKNLWLATIGDSEGLRKALSKRWPFNEDFTKVDHLDRTVLHLAIDSGSTDAVQLLLESGLNPNVVDGMEHTPLFYATVKRPSLPIARLLFQHGAVIPPRKTSTDLGLFLEFVIMSKPTPVEEQLMELLVENGALLEDPDAPGGRQALHYAAMSNNTELISTLINLGADLNVVNHLGMTPMDVAVFYLCRDAQFCLEDIGISRIFGDLGMSRRDF